MTLSGAGKAVRIVAQSVSLAAFIIILSSIVKGWIYGGRYWISYLVWNLEGEGPFELVMLAAVFPALVYAFVHNILRDARET